jgi:hypothetical protein
MTRPLIERCTDTIAFRLALALAGLAVVPVLLMGVQATLIGGAMLFGGRSALELEHAAVALLSVGGALGFVGFLRSPWGVKAPDRHNVTATLVFLAAGVLAALSVAAFVLATAAASWLEPWGSSVWLVLGALFAMANLVWALAGLASMQRLVRRYAQHTGRVFDGLPVLILFVAIALATAAALATVTL